MLSQLEAAARSHSHTDLHQIYFLSCNYSSSRIFQTLMPSAMETSIFQNLFNWAIQEFPPKLQLKMINLQCIHNNTLKGKCPEKNLGEFLYIPSHNLASLVPPHGKEPACSSGDPGSIPGSGRSPGEGNGFSLQCPCLENPVAGGA